MLKPFRFIFTVAGASYLLLVISSCDLFEPNKEETPAGFNRTFGGELADRFQAVCETSDGNFAATGFFNYSGGKSCELVCLLMSSEGEELWTRTFGALAGSQGHEVIETTDGDFVITGETNSVTDMSSDVYLVKVSASGDSLWSRIYGGTNLEVGYSVQETMDGGFIITGYELSFVTGWHDVLLIKTDSNGDLQWSQTYGGPTGEKGHSVRQMANGGFIIAGYTESFGAGIGDVWLLATDSNGDSLWSRTYGGVGWDGGSSVRQTQDGGFIIAGYSHNFSSSFSDMWLIKTDSTGRMEWNQIYGEIRNSSSVASCVQQTEDGGYIVVGGTNARGAGSTDVWLVKTDATGSKVWSQTYGGANSDRGEYVVQTRDGGFIIAGWAFSISRGYSDAWLIKTDSKGRTTY